MTHEEIKNKISDLSDEALKIDKISDLLEDMERALSKKDISYSAQKALEFGYIKLLNLAYGDVRDLWLHIYNLKMALEKEPKEETPYVPPVEDTEDALV